MPFSFRLESILNWKKSLEESSQLRLSEKVKQLKMQEEEIEQLILERYRNDQRLQEKMARGVKIGEILLYQQFGEDLYQDLLVKEGKKRETLNEIEVERKGLMSLMKERKMLERLKEKRLRRFAYKMGKWDQKVNDDTVIIQYRSNRKLISCREFTSHERSSETPLQNDP